MGSVFVVKKFGIDVWPELFNEVGDPVNPDLKYPPLPGLGPGAVGAWVIEVGNAGSGAVAHDFSEIGSGIALVVAGDDEA